MVQMPKKLDKKTMEKISKLGHMIIGDMQGKWTKYRIDYESFLMFQEKFIESKNDGAGTFTFLLENITAISLDISQIKFAEFFNSDEILKILKD